MDAQQRKTVTGGEGREEPEAGVQDGGGLPEVAVTGDAPTLEELSERREELRARVAAHLRALRSGDA
ncbi:hypothetical protein SAMN05421773_11555 [Streptomyces aidingensis]|uniref:Uncharacterized protein n=2 Tax=Streptomyces TaxID=1883 RepID=A0A1I1SBE6_9ACTN|nr:hypothetical protein SAMN05421773_11555 [Streptomyces aidingensis]